MDKSVCKNNFVKSDIIDAFYKNWIDYKNYLNEVIYSLSSRKKLPKTQECNNDSQLKKINLFEKEMRNLKNVNQILKEHYASQIKISDLLSKLHYYPKTNGNSTENTLKKKNGDPGRSANCSNKWISASNNNHRRI